MGARGGSAAARDPLQEAAESLERPQLGGAQHDTTVSTTFRDELDSGHGDTLWRAFVSQT